VSQRTSLNNESLLWTDLNALERMDVDFRRNGMDWIRIEHKSWLLTDLNGLERRKLVLELLEWIRMQVSKFRTDWKGL
jgi:hypothetical protein